MKLYHGSDVSISEIDLTKSRPYKDFGKGFYLSDDFVQALEMAEQRASQKGGNSIPVVTTFEFDENLLLGGDLNVKLWNDYCEEWAEFVLRNRNRMITHPCHKYDIVYGPIADDGVTFQLRRFQAGYLTIEQLVEELKFQKGITFQYYFANEKAISKLRLVCDSQTNR